MTILNDDEATVGGAGDEDAFDEEKELEGFGLTEGDANEGESDLDESSAGGDAE